MNLSIVTTLYRSAPYIGESYERAVSAATQHSSDVEILSVNEGSSGQALDLHRKDARVCLIDGAWSLRPDA